MNNTQPKEIIKVTEHRVACEGDGGALGHPRVWLDIGEAHQVSCPYCGRHYEQDSQK